MKKLLLHGDDSLVVGEDSLIIGVDEAGRGALAGPVCAAAVVDNGCLSGKPYIKDSKLLSAEKRLEAFNYIVKHCYYGIGFSSALEIDRLNILQSSMCAMERALAKIGKAFPANSIVLVDGKHVPTGLPIRMRPIVGGDRLFPAISAASILAKVSRDGSMAHLDQIYPEYGWGDNKGYPTRKHLEAVVGSGVNRNHRKTFAPIAKILNQRESF